MKGFVTILLCAAIVSPATAGTRSASLTLSATQPITVGGSRFRASEMVGLTVRVQGARYSRQVRADAQGAFRVVFPRLAAGNACDVAASARGAKGSRAQLQFSERVCPTFEP